MPKVLPDEVAATRSLANVDEGRALERQRARRELIRKRGETAPNPEGPAHAPGEE